MSDRDRRKSHLLLVLLAVALHVLAITGATVNADEEVTRVILFAGQSNMVGSDAHADRIDNYPPFVGAGKPQDGVLYSYVLERNAASSNGWIPLQALKSFGPEITFARLAKQHVDFPIAIIKSAVGGTTLARDWNPDAPDDGLKLYPRTLKLVRDSLKQLDDKGIAYRLEAVMWHQGENDMLNRELNGQYGARLQAFVPRLRKDLAAPDLKFFIGEISEKGIWGMDHRQQLASVKKQQRIARGMTPSSWWVPTSHLAFEVMSKGQPHYHFGTQGQLQLGEAFAEAWLGTVRKPVIRNQADFHTVLRGPKNKPFRLFVLAGQRNMEGEDAFVSQIPNVKGFESLDRGNDQIAFEYSLGGVRRSYNWERLRPVDFLGNFGPELSFGPRVKKAVDGGVAIVKFTHSGSQMPDWLPQGSPERIRNFYKTFSAFIGGRRQRIRRSGYDCQIGGIFWHIGENDTYYNHRRYTEWMKQLIHQLRKDLNEPELKWVISEQHPKSPWKNIDAINADMRALAATDANITMVPTAHLPHERLHFGTEGTLKLGVALADAWIASEKPAIAKSDPPARLLPIPQPKLSRTLARPDTLMLLDVDWSPDGKWIAAGGSTAPGRQVLLWDAATGERSTILKAEPFGLSKIRFTSNGKALVLGGDAETRTIRTVDLTSGRRLSELANDYPAHAMAVSPDSRLIAASTGGKAISLWDAQSAERITTLNGHRDDVMSVVFSPNGKQLISSGGWEYHVASREIRVWDLKTHTTTLTIRGSFAPTRCLAISPDGKLIAARTRYNTIKLWNIQDGQERHSIRIEGEDDESPFLSIAFSPDGRILATGTADSDLMFWSVATGQHLMTGKCNNDALMAMAFNPDGTHLAVAGRQVQVWSLRPTR